MPINMLTFFFDSAVSWGLFVYFSEYLRRVTLKPGEVQPKLASYRGDPNNRSIPEEDEDDKENKTGLFLFKSFTNW